MVILIASSPLSAVWDIHGLESTRYSHQVCNCLMITLISELCGLSIVEYQLCDESGNKLIVMSVKKVNNNF
jgi:hypothetical protein